MDFVDQHHLPICTAAKFVFGIHQDQAGSMSDLLPAFEESQRRCLDDFPGFGIQIQPCSTNLGTGQALIMTGWPTFGGGGDDGFW